LSTSVPANTGADGAVETEVAADEDLADRTLVGALLSFPDDPTGEFGVRIASPGHGTLLPGNAEQRTGADGFLRGTGGGSPVRVPLGVFFEGGPLRARFINTSGTEKRVMAVVVTQARAETVARPMTGRLDTSPAPRTGKGTGH